MKRSFFIVPCLALTLGCGGNQVQPAEPEPEPAVTDVTAPEPEQPAAQEKPLAEVTEKLDESSLPDEIYLNISVKGFGDIVVSLYGADAPKSVTNIANLAIEGFYNGLVFHRVVPGFVVQGGDPEGTGAGGPGYTVDAEIKHKHEKGCLAMARKPDQVNPTKASSGSQFYFCLQDLPDLDGEYTVIGKIVEGLDVMEKLGEVKTGKKDRPLDPPVMETVTVTAR
jgi:cyclophilin family peptidyl-prolyl cis-trans isomerase